MSLLAISTVRTLPDQGIELPPRDRFVLYALADYADDRLRAWPSYSTLASWTGYARSTIAESLAELESRGLISSEQRTRPNGSLSSKVYRLTFAERGGIPAPGTPPVREADHPRPGAGTPPVREADPQNHQIEPPEEPPPTPAPEDELDVALDRDLREAEEANRIRGAKSYDRAVLASAHPNVWRALAPISSSKGWKPEQLRAVAKRVLELTRDHGDDRVADLLREILLNVAEIRSPIAYLERALAKSVGRVDPPAAGASSVNLDEIFGGPS